jgi:hypothetical protein
LIKRVREEREEGKEKKKNKCTRGGIGKIKGNER